MSADAHAAEIGWLFPKPDTASTALPKVPSLLVQGKRTMSPEATTSEEPSKANERNMLTAAAGDSLPPSDEQKGGGLYDMYLLHVLS